MDVKSRNDNITMTASYERQRKHIIDLKNDIPSALKISSPILKSFSENNFLHVFMTTFEQRIFMKENCLILGKTITETYFSFMYPLFQTLVEHT
jgi:hypothetical protein